MSVAIVVIVAKASMYLVCVARFEPTSKARTFLTDGEGAQRKIVWLSDRQSHMWTRKYFKDKLWGTFQQFEERLARRERDFFGRAG